MQVQQGHDVGVANRPIKAKRRPVKRKRDLIISRNTVTTQALPVCALLPPGLAMCKRRGWVCGILPVGPSPIICSGNIFCRLSSCGSIGLDWDDKWQTTNRCVPKQQNAAVSRCYAHGFHVSIHVGLRVSQLHSRGQVKTKMGDNCARWQILRMVSKPVVNSASLDTPKWGTLGRAQDRASAARRNVVWVGTL